MAKLNDISKLLNEESRHRPHYISASVWSEMKGIFSDIRSTMVVKIIPQSTINLIEHSIQHQIDMLANIATASELFEVIMHITNLIEYYLDLAVVAEEYEIAENLRKLIDKMSIKVIK